MSRPFLDILTGLVLPRKCEICGRDLLDGEKCLCMHCLVSLPLCREPEAEIRLSRITRRAPVARVSAWLSYTHDSDVARIIRRGKYNGRPDIFASLGEMLAGRLVASGVLAGVDALVPVPMHWLKRMRRGYNQAAIIAQAISAASGLPVLRGAVRAVRAGRHQAGADAAARADNVSGRFSATRPLDGLHVAVVDDILTTGATVSGVVSALAGCSPRAISIVTLAAAPSPG